MKSTCFNPRTRKGCDNKCTPFCSMEDMVSIHAPARGATATHVTFRVLPRFQSTHPQGVRQPVERSCAIGDEFQSTHPQGVRRRCRARGPRADGFNPRTRKGCDLSFPNLLRRRFKFQSTHPQGVRRSAMNVIQCTKEFQSTHPQGVRLGKRLLHYK